MQDANPAKTVDVVGVGNAMVDVLTQSTDDFLKKQDMVKNSMTLIEEARARQLYDLIEDGVAVSGGSAANTMAGVASFGGTASYIGKVADDELGKVFIEDMRSIGVNFDMEPTAVNPATGRCMIFVTPDAQRTMNTFLGLSSLLEPADIDQATVASGQLLFCEGYLWDVESAKQAIRLAMDMSHDAGRKTALTLSDLFCVERHQTEFRDLVSERVDILFANRQELRGLYEIKDLDAAIDRVRGEVDLACVTLGKEGSVLVTEDEIVEIPAAEVAPVVDTTGAGDQYAAGVLFGLSHNLDLATAGALGSLAAAEVIAHFGPRPERSLAALAAEHGLLPTA